MLLLKIVARVVFLYARALAQYMFRGSEETSDLGRPGL